MKSFIGTKLSEFQFVEKLLILCNQIDKVFLHLALVIVFLSKINNFFANSLHSLSCLWLDKLPLW